ncbi:MAG: 30S ribosomal protein S4 [Microgenomates group bacterium]
MKYTGPRNRIARREGIDLGLKTPGSKNHLRLLRRLNILPGQHGIKGRKRYSERGEQLREKQKLKFLYLISEKQLKRYFKNALKKKGDTATNLINLLERRLDNVVFRLGFAPTRAAARQLVAHGHIKVNDRKVKIPSYLVEVDDIISFSKDKITKVDYIEKSLKNKDLVIAPWLKRENLVGKVISEPVNTDIEKLLNLRLIVDYYSR